MAWIMRAQGLVKHYRRGSETVMALRGVDIEVGPSEFVALMGASGSGKTTLLNVLVGWEEPDEGRVDWHDGTATADVRWSGLGIVPQRLGLIDELTIRENVALPLRLRNPAGGVSDHAPVTSWLGLFGLIDSAERLPAEVSLGEQQRAALARGLVTSPQLLVADEPTGHQDEDSADAVITALRQASTQGVAVLVATHDEHIASQTDRVLHIHDGAIIDRGDAILGQRRSSR